MVWTARDGFFTTFILPWMCERGFLKFKFLVKALWEWSRFVSFGVLGDRIRATVPLNIYTFQENDSVKLLCYLKYRRIWRFPSWSSLLPGPPWALLLSHRQHLQVCIELLECPDHIRKKAVRLANSSTNTFADFIYLFHREISIRGAFRRPPYFTLTDSSMSSKCSDAFFSPYRLPLGLRINKGRQFGPLGRF
jgi:hypothetical protein